MSNMSWGEKVEASSGGRKKIDQHTFRKTGPTDGKIGRTDGSRKKGKVGKRFGVRMGGNPPKILQNFREHFGKHSILVNPNATSLRKQDDTKTNQGCSVAGLWILTNDMSDLQIFPPDLAKEVANALTWIL